MNIIASASHPLRREQHLVAVPDAAPAPSPSAVKSLLGSAAATAKPTTALVAGWKLTTVPHMVSNDDLTSLFMKNNVPQPKAMEMAQDVRGFFANPVVRTVTVAVSGGVAAYLVVQKTAWSKGTKLAIAIGVGLIFGGLYLLLRHYGYQT